MRCPYCNCDDTQVKDSRPTEDNTSIRRRRVCSDCGGRFTTFERIQLRELTVIKKDGRKVSFDRDKLANSISLAVRKRDVDHARIERMVSGIVRRLESSGDSEVEAGTIGTMVMEGLKGLDLVAYVRFASVYRDFTEASDFQAVLGELSDAEGEDN
ncbi:MAG: transcriptional regulator NrdR [Rhizobiaceae bacterium]